MLKLPCWTPGSLCEDCKLQLSCGLQAQMLCNK